MTKSQRINPILKLAEKREQDAARALGGSQHRLLEHQQRLDQLLSYREEYAQRMQEHGVQGITVSQMQGYQTFLSRLDAGIREQQYVLSSAMQEVDRCRSAWQATHIRSQALDKVQLRYLAEEVKVQDKRDQKDSDERALRIYTTAKPD